MELESLPMLLIRWRTDVNLLFSRSSLFDYYSSIVFSVIVAHFDKPVLFHSLKSTPINGCLFCFVLLQCFMLIFRIELVAVGECCNAGRSLTTGGANSWLDNLVTSIGLGWWRIRAQTAAPGPRPRPRPIPMFLCHRAVRIDGEDWSSCFGGEQANYR